MHKFKNMNLCIFYINRYIILNYIKTFAHKVDINLHHCYDNTITYAHK